MIRTLSECVKSNSNHFKVVRKGNAIISLFKLRFPKMKVVHAVKYYRNSYKEAANGT